MDSGETVLFMVIEYMDLLHLICIQISAMIRLQVLNSLGELTFSGYQDHMHHLVYNSSSYLIDLLQGMWLKTTRKMNPQKWWDPQSKTHVS